MPVLPALRILPFLVTGIGSEFGTGLVLEADDDGWKMAQTASDEQLVANFYVPPGMPTNIKISAVINYVGSEGDLYYQIYVGGGGDGYNKYTHTATTGWVTTTLDARLAVCNAILPSLNITVAEGDVLSLVFVRDHLDVLDTFAGTAHLVGFLIEEQ